MQALKGSWVKRAGLLAGPALFVLLTLLADIDGPRAPALADEPPDAVPRATRMAAVAVWMAVWWISEPIPIPATSLLPLVLFPLLGIMPARDVAPRYADSNVFLFLGGFLIALAIERCELHRRVALAAIAMTGDRPRRMVFGFMAASFALSMWLSNTATAMMMLPIALSVLAEAEHAQGKKEDFSDKPGFSAKALHAAFATALLLGIAYSASLGGMTTLVGTPPNIAFRTIYEQTFPGAPTVSFLDWMLFALPMALVFLVLAWMVLVFVVCPCRGERLVGGQERIRELRRALGPMTPAQRRVLVVFVVTTLLWMTRADIDLGGRTLPGWAGALALDSVDDSTVAIAMALLLFVLPAGDGRAHAPHPNPLPQRGRGQGQRRRLLDWHVADRVPWGVLLLFGGGFALAAGFETTGLAAWIGARFAELLGGQPPLPLMIAATCLMMTFLTELTSNTATTQMILPILAGVSVSLDGDPLLLMIPATISASCAFMLPVATPPNAIVFGSGRVPIQKMVTAGLLLNFVGVVVVTLTAWLLVPAVVGIR